MTESKVQELSGPVLGGEQVAPDRLNYPEQIQVDSMSNTLALLGSINLDRRMTDILRLLVCEPLTCYRSLSGFSGPKCPRECPRKRASEGAVSSLIVQKCPCTC